MPLEGRTWPVENVSMDVSMGRDSWNVSWGERASKQVQLAGSTPLVMLPASLLLMEVANVLCQAHKVLK